MDKIQRPVVFLDRDGTLNVEAGYIRDREDLRLVSGAAESVKKLNCAGVAAVLVTNQSGAARGFYQESHILELHERLQALLRVGGAYLDAVYYCPHLAEATVAQYALACDCRKPEVGMVVRAFEEHAEFDRNRAYVVGDKTTDIELAKNCNLKSVLVKTGYGRGSLDLFLEGGSKPTHIADSIVEAIDWILQDLQDSP